ncbi:MAG: MarR family winged helix-turn-helix transcriptional regulator, partial [Tepidisphaeraceae bacterium]
VVKCRLVEQVVDWERASAPLMPDQGGAIHAEDARDILDAVRRIVQTLRIASRASEKQLGLSAAQLFVISRLAGARAMSLNELAARTLTHQSSVSVVVSKLVDRGLVERISSGEDRRRLELSLTSAGLALAKRAPTAAQDRLIDALSRMKSTDVRQLARLLRRFVEEMGLGQEPAPLLFDEEGKEA